MTEDIASPDGVQTLARTIWGENRGAGVPGMQSVANVILNRINRKSWYGGNVVDVCLKHQNGVYQFSCWSPHDPNYHKLIDPTLAGDSFSSAIYLATMALIGKLPDITNGATNYYAKSMNEPPSWAKGRMPCADLGGQLFFREIG